MLAFDGSPPSIMLHSLHQNVQHATIATSQDGRRSSCGVTDNEEQV
jgi:hypothetical protein